MHNPKLFKASLAILALTILVILFGAFVRATGSGAGCGQHWPTCNGEIIPRSPGVETIIEFTHRITSGIAFLLFVVLTIWVFRSYRPGAQIRWAAGFSMFFMITEALVGAGLVLFEMVAHNTSIARGYWMGAHLINTFLLLASLTMVIWYSYGNEKIQIHYPIGFLLLLGIIGMLVLGVSGAITALGDTLFPTTSLAEGFKEDFSPSAHIFLRLRIWHPITAIIVSLYWLILAGVFYPRDGSPRKKAISTFLIVSIITQMIIGPINLILLAPVFMQIIHLFVADVVWIGVVLLCAENLTATEPMYSKNNL